MDALFAAFLFRFSVFFLLLFRPLVARGPFHGEINTDRNGLFYGSRGRKSDKRMAFLSAI